MIVDSGFRRGSDVFKALALGASAVELGRAARWGLGAFGAAGAQRLLEIMQAGAGAGGRDGRTPHTKAIDQDGGEGEFRLRYHARRRGRSFGPWAEKVNFV